MDVVVHEHIGMKSYAREHGRFPKQLQEAEPVAIVREARQPVVAALHDVLGNIG